MLRRASMKREQSNHFARFSSKADFKNIYDVWLESCNKENITLSKNVHNEFKKRMASKGKSKLNLANCSLNDRMVTLLLEVLAKRPVISKLDLSSNDISTKGAEAVLKVLRAQCKIVSNIPLDNRLPACLFGEVSLQGSTKGIDLPTYENIRQLCDALRYCNAQAHVRAQFLEQRIPEPVTTPYMLSLWTEIIGKPDRYSLLSAFTSALKSEKSLLTYWELELLLLQGLIDKGELVELNEWQWQQIAKPNNDGGVFSKLMNIIEPASRSGSRSGSRHGSRGNSRANSASNSRANSVMGEDENNDLIRFLNNKQSAEEDEDAAAAAALANQSTVVHPNERSLLFAELNESTATDGLSSGSATPLGGSSPKSPLTGAAGASATAAGGGGGSSSPGRTAAAASATQWGPVRAVIPLSPNPLRPPLSPTTAGTGRSSPRSSPRGGGSNNVVGRSALKSPNSTPRRNSRDRQSPGGSGGGRGTPLRVKISTPTSSSRSVYGSPSKAGTSSSPNNSSTASLTGAAAASRDSGDGSEIIDRLDQMATNPISSLASAAGANKRQNSMNMFLAAQTDLIMRDEDLPDISSSSSSNSDKFRRTGLVRSQGVLGGATTQRAASEQQVFASEEDVSESSQRQPQVVLVIDTPSPTKRSRPAGAGAVGGSPSAGSSLSNHLSPIARSKQHLSDSHHIDSDDATTPPPPPPPAVAAAGSVAMTEEAAALQQYLLQKEQQRQMLDDASDDDDDNNKGEVRPVSAEFDSMMSALFPKTASPHNSAATRSTAVGTAAAADVTDGDDKYSPSEYIVIPPPSKWSLMTVLVQDHKGLTNIDFSEHLDPEQFSALRVLVLRDNLLSELTPLKLGRHFKFVTDLDLSYNLLHGVILKNALPKALLRLDLSHNKIVDVSGLMLCVSLVELNLSHNCIKRFDGLPVTLRKLDLSHNLISSLISLRALSLSDKLTTLFVAHNPVVKSQPTQYKVLLRSILINLIELDGELQVKQKLQLRKRETEQQHSQTVFEAHKQHQQQQTRVAPAQQQANDKMRSQLHELKLKALDQTKEAIDRRELEEVARNKKVIPARAAAELSNRLSGSSIAAAKGRRLSAGQAASSQSNQRLPAPLDLTKIVMTPNSLVHSYMNIRKAAGATGSLAEVGGGGGVSTEDMAEEINDWLAKKQYEASKAAALIRMCCDLCHSGPAITPGGSGSSSSSGSKLNEKTVQSVLRALRRLDCYKAVNGALQGEPPSAEQEEEQLFLLRVDYLLSRHHNSSSGGSSRAAGGITADLAANVTAVREQSQRLGQFFTQLEGILLQSIASPAPPSTPSAAGPAAVYVFTYTKLFHSLMASPLGEYVNRTVLVLQGEPFKPSVASAGALSASGSHQAHSFSFAGVEGSGRAVSPVRSSSGVGGVGSKTPTAAATAAAAPLKDVLVNENISHNMSNLLAEDDKQLLKQQQQKKLSQLQPQQQQQHSAARIVKPIVTEPIAVTATTTSSAVSASEDDLTVELSELLTVSDNDVIIDKMKERIRSRVTTPATLDRPSSTAPIAAAAATTTTASSGAVTVAAVAAALSKSLSSSNMLSTNSNTSTSSSNGGIEKAALPSTVVLEKKISSASVDESAASVRDRATSTPPPPPAVEASGLVVKSALLAVPVTAAAAAAVESEVESIVRDRVESDAATPPLTTAAPYTLSHGYFDGEFEQKPPLSDDDEEVEDDEVKPATHVSTDVATIAATSTVGVVDVIDTVLTLDSCDEDLAGVRIALAVDMHYCISSSNINNNTELKLTPPNAQRNSSDSETTTAAVEQKDVTEKQPIEDEVVKSLPPATEAVQVPNKEPIKEPLKEPIKEPLPETAPSVVSPTSGRKTVKPPSVDSLLTKASSSANMITPTKQQQQQPSVNTSADSSATPSPPTSVLSPVKAALSKFNSHNFSQHIHVESSTEDALKTISAAAALSAHNSPDSSGSSAVAGGGGASSDGYVYASVKDRVKARVGKSDSKEDQHVPAPPLQPHLMKSKSNSTSSINIGGAEKSTAATGSAAVAASSATRTTAAPSVVPEALRSTVEPKPSSDNNSSNSSTAASSTAAAATLAAPSPVRVVPTPEVVADAAATAPVSEITSSSSSKSNNYFMPVDVKDATPTPSTAAAPAAATTANAGSAVVNATTAASDEQPSAVVSPSVVDSTNNSRPTSALSGAEGKMSAKERILARQAANKKAKAEAAAAAASGSDGGAAV